MRRLRSRLTYANVMSTLAVVLALGGGVAYAANTVFSSDIVNGQVKAADIATGAVQDDEIAAGAVKTGEIATNQVRAADIGPDQINGSKVADQGLSGVDILDSSVSSADLATNSVLSEEVLDNTLTADDLATNSVGFFELAGDAVASFSVINHSLRGRDVGEAEFVTFNASMPAVSARTCNSGLVTGLPNDARDHLLLTESAVSTRPWIFNVAAYSNTAGQALIRRCNLADFNEPAGNHTFNLLVINAQ